MSSAAQIICLLDDEPSVLKAIGRLFASDGLTAEKFSAPEPFLEFAKGHPVRLAVIDIRLPGITGLEVLAELRAASPDTRVIMMTGELDPTHRSTVMAGGASAFFQKPFDDRSFLLSVHEALAR